MQENMKEYLTEKEAREKRLEVYTVNIGVRPHKEKINISEEFINKGSGSSLRCC